MKERSKEKMAELLMEELLEQLRERDSIKRMLGDMTAIPVEELLEQLLDEFERAVERRRVQSIEEARTRREKKSKAAELPPPSAFGEIHSDAPIPTIPPRSVIPSDVPSSERVSQSEQSVEEAIVEKPTLSPGVTGSVMDKLGVEFRSIPLYIPSLDDHAVDAGLKTVQETISRQGPSELPSVVVKPVEPREDVRSVLDRKKEERIEDRREDIDAAKGSHTEDEPERDFDFVEEEVSEEVSDKLESDMALTKGTMAKPSYEFADNDYVYVHAVAVIPPEETMSPHPYMLEEKGIDDRNFAFAFEYERMRFFLSKFNPESMSVSKTGVLLLGKQETLQLQGVQESILNDLRIHSPLLPFKFGTVSRGRDHLLGLIDDHKDDLREALEEIATTKWWTLSAYVLDTRIAQLVGPQVPTRGREREHHRTSYSQPALTKKYDVKTLERMLQKEKKLAESVHEEMKKYAERSDIDMIVSLGSGSSEDWKPILKASYEVTERSLRHFNRAVTDLQYHHIMFDLMLSLTGERECFSFE
jgi:hypothetical protein